MLDQLSFRNLILECLNHYEAPSGFSTCDAPLGVLWLPLQPIASRTVLHLLQVPEGAPCPLVGLSTIMYALLCLKQCCSEYGLWAGPCLQTATCLQGSR